MDENCKSLNFNSECTMNNKFYEKNWNSRLHTEVEGASSPRRSLMSKARSAAVSNKSRYYEAPTTEVFIILALTSLVYGESPAPYPASGWRPQGQQFSLPSQQSVQQYGAPSQYNTLQYSAPQQLNQEYGQPQINNQYGAPSISNQYGTPQNQNRGPQNQYTSPQNQFTSQQNQYSGSQNQNRPQNQYNVPLNGENGSVDPVRVQYLPNEQQPRNFGTNFRQTTLNNQNIPAPDRTYLSQTSNNQNTDSNNLNLSLQNTNRTPQNLNPNHQNPKNLDGNLQPQPQVLGQLKSQNSNFDNPQNVFSSSNQDFQNVELISTRQNPKNARQNKQETREGDEFQPSERQEQSENPGDEVSRKYGSPKQLGRQPKSERTTAKPSTTELPETDENSDGNIAISTAVAGDATSGHYYILQQDGRLQRVVYMTSPDPNGNKNAAMLANLMYELVEPIKGPIYQYFGNQLIRIN